MRLLTIAAFFSGLFCFQTCNCDQAAAQHFQKSGGDTVVNYQPSDPWTRGRWFNTQTGNSGWFYNCDGEQAKRNSPYICWKPDDEPMLPPLVAPWTTWRQQLGDVRQRIYDGSCGDQCCTCADCRQARRNGQQGGCAACAQAAANRSRQSSPGQFRYEAAHSMSVEFPVVDSDHGVKYGLVQGNMINPETTRRLEAPVSPPVKESSVAKKSLLDQLRATTRR